MKTRSILLLIVSGLAFAGCEKAVQFKLDKSEPKLVVDATIENGQAPVVILTRSLDYFSSIDLPTLSNSFVHNAEVFISNGTMTHKLKEYAVPVGNFNFYYYSNNPLDITTLFNGELKKQYSLRIVSEGKEYLATTKIPDTTRRIDTLFAKPAPPGNEPDRWAVMLRATDKPGFGDYIRYFTKRNSEPFYPGLNSVYDDQIIDGSTYEVRVERGVDRSVNHPEGFSFFYAGDTVTLKLCNIDKATFDFWRTMEFAYDNIGNPFATPTKVISNLSGGALGYFGGYAAQFKTIVLPH